MATEVFGTSVDLAAVTLHRGADGNPIVLAARAIARLSGSDIPAITIGNSIYLLDESRFFQGDGLTLASGSDSTLVHELTHVWQFQTGGPGYAESAIVPNAGYQFAYEDRNLAYDWGRAVAEGRDWSTWGAEQQAEAVEDYYKASFALSRAVDAGGATADTFSTVSTLEPYIDMVRTRQGAATWGSHGY